MESTRPDVDCSLDVLGQVIDITSSDQKLRELRALLRIGPAAFHGFHDSFDFEPDGPWIRVGLIFTPERAAPQFTPPKVPPRSNPPKLCATGVGATPSGLDYRPAPPSSGAGGPLGMLPATGRDDGLVAVGGLVATAVLLRLLVRHVPHRRRRT